MNTQRQADADNQFNIPDAVRFKATAHTKAGVKISVTPRELIQQMGHADDALNGDSNDAEHDALYQLREWLSTVFEDPDRRNKHG